MPFESPRDFVRIGQVSADLAVCEPSLMQIKVLCPLSTVVRVQDGQDRCDNGTLKNTKTKSAYKTNRFFNNSIPPLESEVHEKNDTHRNYASHCSLGHTFENPRLAQIEK